jgi:hypothetical protein
MTPALLGAGLRAISVVPAALGRTKAAIAALDLGRPAAAHPEHPHTQAETDG